MYVAVTEFYFRDTERSENVVYVNGSIDKQQSNDIEQVKMSKTEVLCDCHSDIGNFLCVICIIFVLLLICSN